tara:strand:- start:380 stop:847 length:468 start_codon:yes stop_codon:yes gene_type:complete
MKIIFLDVDGVLNNVNDGTFSQSQAISGENFNNLKHIVAATNAKVVLSTSWRHDAGLAIISKHLEDANIEVIGLTPSLCPTIIMNDEDDVPRSVEIQVWLDKNVAKFDDLVIYVILDDEDHAADNNMQMNFIHVNTRTGLTEDDATKAVEILTKG